jgi:hypothetical protein
MLPSGKNQVPNRKKERKENAGFHERLVLVNVLDSAGD